MYSLQHRMFIILKETFIQKLMEFGPEILKLYGNLSLAQL